MANPKNEDKCNSELCLQHSEIMTRLKSHDKRLDKIDLKNFVPFGNFRWVVGILVGMIFSLYGFAVKTIYDNQTALIDIKLQQRTTIHKIETLQDTTLELKRQIKEAQWIKKR